MQNHDRFVYILAILYCLWPVYIQNGVGTAIRWCNYIRKMKPVVAILNTIELYFNKKGISGLQHKQISCSFRIMKSLNHPCNHVGCSS